MQVDEVRVHRKFGGCPALRLNSVIDFTNPQVIDGTKKI
jgi:hypothetical protein